jgi:hypothetical protein
MADRTFTADRFGILLDDSEFLGFTKKVAGGVIRAELAQHQLGPANISKKHIDAIAYEDFTFKAGMGMSRGFYEWIQSAFDGAHIAKNGEIHACDFDGNSMSVREFRDATISAIKIPTLGGSRSGPACMTVKLTPREIKYARGTGSQIGAELPRLKKKENKKKEWRRSNFRFELGDLPCARVARIESFTWKLAVSKDEVGEFRIPTLHPTRIEVPNLNLTISMADVKPWEAWHRSFVIEGNCGDEAELDGSITFLAPNRRRALARIHLRNVGILSLDTWDRKANKEEVARFAVELYVEDMKFEYLAVDA